MSEEGLFEINGSAKPERAGDVIFVHGLNGNRTTTWSRDGFYWPGWLSSEAPAVGVWAYGYSAAAFDWQGATMAFKDRASNLLEWIDVHGLGCRPLILIGHSLGGIVIKAALEQAHIYQHPAAKAVRGVVFLATPHAGSTLADFMSRYRTVTQASTSLQELRKGEPELLRLNAWYQQQAPTLGIATKVYYETLPLHSFTAVDAVTANPGLRTVQPVAVLANHIDIARPTPDASLVHKAALQFVGRLLDKPQPPEAGKISTSVETYNHLVALELAEKVRAEIALGNFDNIIRYKDVLSELDGESNESRRQK